LIENYFEKIIIFYHKFQEGFFAKKPYKEKKSPTIVYNMIRCLGFCYFYILNIAKIWLNILMDDLPLEQHHNFFL